MRSSGPAIDAPRAVSGQVLLQIIDPKVPQLSGGTGLLPTGGIRERTLLFSVDASHIDASARPKWTVWNARVGREFAADVLHYCFGGDGSWPVIPAGEPLDRRQQTGLPDADWVQALPVQAQDQVLDWLAPFQTPLVRGWTGVIEGETFRKKVLAKNKPRSMP